MKLDHVSFASEPDGYKATAERISEKLGVVPYDGGVHPRFGTRNLIFPLANGHYLEVVEALEHPAALSTPFGQAVRARSELGGGWMGWCVSVDDLAGVET
ncbi:MAG: VOC family protein, partial [Brevibacterium sp.]|nr:VOC family protein [Brevibacterium sp.]